MKFSFMGYSDWKYNSQTIKARLQKVLDSIKQIKADGIQFDCLVVHGTSGTWLAPLLVLEGYNVVMVRKEGERSHGSPIEGPGEWQNTGLDLTKGIFIDDLISSGDTIGRVRKLLKESSVGNELKLVAIALHSYHAGYGENYFQELPLYS